MATVTVTKSGQSKKWTDPVVGGLLALALAAGICAGLIAWGHATFFETNDHARQRFRQVFPVLEGSAAAVLGFQRVPVTVDRQETPGGPGSRPAERLTYRIVVSPLGGLLLVGLALVVGGAVTQRRHTHGQSVIASGARTAAVFAVACFILSFLVPLGEALIQQGPNAGRGYTMTYRPSHVAALIWPLVWGLVFGSLGAFIGKHGRRWRRELLGAIEARSAIGAIAVRAALTGLATGVALVLFAGVLTAAVGSMTHRSAAAEVLGSVRNVAGIAEGVVVGLPHATGGGLLASMGVPARYEVVDHKGEHRDSATASIFGRDSINRVIRGGIGESTGPTVPRYALGGLLIAIAFTMVTGYRAAAGSGGDLGQAVPVVVAAAACLTVFFWIVGYLFGGAFDITVRLGSDVVGSRGTIGPSPLGLLLLPPAWTLGGGFLGAALRSVRAPREVDVTPS